MKHVACIIPMFAATVCMAGFPSSFSTDSEFDSKIQQLEKQCASYSSRLNFLSQSTGNGPNTQYNQMRGLFEACVDKLQVVVCEYEIFKMDQIDEAKEYKRTLLDGVRELSEVARGRVDRFHQAREWLTELRFHPAVNHMIVKHVDRIIIDFVWNINGDIELPELEEESIEGTDRILSNIGVRGIKKARDVILNDECEIAALRAAYDELMGAC